MSDTPILSAEDATEALCLTSYKLTMLIAKMTGVAKALRSRPELAPIADTITKALEEAERP